MDKILYAMIDAAGGLWGAVLCFFAALLAGGSIWLAINKVGAWTRADGGLWKEMTGLQKVTWTAIAAAAFGVVDTLYWQFIIDGALGISIIHWFSFLGAIIGFVFFSYRIKYQEQQIGKQAKQIQLQAKQLRLQVRKEIDDRFHSAVELLGNSEMSARTGAIYSLYHFATKNNKYRRGVAQILCSHIRSKTQEDGYEEKHKSRPSNEIQTAINLLFRDVDGIDGLYKNPKTAQKLSIADLSHSYLAGARLSGAHCQGADFEKAQLQGARFAGAKCQGADFENASCQCADFKDAHCQGAYFGDADCKGVDFEDAKCQGAVFQMTLCQGASFKNANFQGAYFEQASCQGIIRDEAKFQGAYDKTAKADGQFYKISQRAAALKNRIGQKKSELKNVFSSGELDAESKNEIESIKKLLGEGWWTQSPETAEDNKGKPEDSTVSNVETVRLEDSREMRNIIAELEAIEKAKEEARK